MKSQYLFGMCPDGHNIGNREELTGLLIHNSVESFLIT